MAFLAEGERLELSRHLAMTYRFSKPAPSPTWVTLHGYKNGAGDRSRTYNLLITNQLLCH